MDKLKAYVPMCCARWQSLMYIYLTQKNCSIENSNTNGIGTVKSLYNCQWVSRIVLISNENYMKIWMELVPQISQAATIKNHSYRQGDTHSSTDPHFRYSLYLNAV